MSVCEQMQKVSAYHDGELSPEEILRLEAHMAGCGACARELKELRSLSRLLAGARVPAAPGELRMRLYGESAVAREHVLIALARRLTAAAAAILIVSSGMVWYGLARNNAGAATPSGWELAAVGLHDDASAGETQQFAQWIVKDLSLENGHE